MHKTSSGFAGLLLLLLASSGHAQIVKITPIDKQRLLIKKLQLIARTEALPSPVRNEFARAAHSKTFRMADPGQEYQVTDVVAKEGLPSRRFIFAGLTNDLCVLHYEHGGIGHGYDLVLFHLSGGKARFVWHGWARRNIQI